MFAARVVDGEVIVLKRDVDIGMWGEERGRFQTQKLGPAEVDQPQGLDPWHRHAVCRGGSYFLFGLDTKGNGTKFPFLYGGCPDGPKTRKQRHVSYY